MLTPGKHTAGGIGEGKALWKSTWRLHLAVGRLVLS